MALKNRVLDSACHMGEQHCGERRDIDVAAGPVAKQQAQRRGGNRRGIRGLLLRNGVWHIDKVLFGKRTIFCCFLFIGFAALSPTSTLLRALIFAMLTLSVLSCVMLPLGVNSIVRKKSELSVRTVAQMLPAAIISLAFIGFIAFLYYRRAALK